MEKYGYKNISNMDEFSEAAKAEGKYDFSYNPGTTFESAIPLILEDVSFLFILILIFADIIRVYKTFVCFFD